MSPILAGLLPLIITATLALTFLATVGAIAYVGLLVIARGDLEPDDESEDE